MTLTLVALLILMQILERVQHRLVHAWQSFGLEAGTVITFAVASSIASMAGRTMLSPLLRLPSYCQTLWMTALYGRAFVCDVMLNKQ